MQDKFLSNIGLARKAGKILIGTEQVRDGIKAGKALVVLISHDASDNTKKEILDSAAFYKVEARTVPHTMKDFSVLLGKSGLVSSIAITDIGFKTLILKSFPHTEV